MDFYHRAALILDSLDAKKGSIKGLCMKEAKRSSVKSWNKRQQPRDKASGAKSEAARFMRIIIEVLKYRPHLIHLINISKIMTKEPTLFVAPGSTDFKTRTGKIKSASDVARNVIKQKTQPQQSRYATPSPENLAQVMIHDVVFAKRGLILAKEHKLRKKLETYKPVFLKETEKQRNKKKVATNEGLQIELPELLAKSLEQIGKTGGKDTLQDLEGLGLSTIRWMRVNTYKWSVEDAVEYLEGAGWELAESIEAMLEISQTKVRVFALDDHVEPLLAMPSGVNLQLVPPFRDSRLIAQDKASCLPPWILLAPVLAEEVLRGPDFIQADDIGEDVVGIEAGDSEEVSSGEEMSLGEEDDAGVSAEEGEEELEMLADEDVDAAGDTFDVSETVSGDNAAAEDGAADSDDEDTVANGGKNGIKVLDATSAPGNKTSMAGAMVEGKGLVFAIERDINRYKILKETLKRTGCTNVTPMNMDFLSIDPENAKFKNVTHIMVDPSCSGSGIANRLDDLVEAQAPLDEEHETRIKSLANFQVAILSHALRFPGAKRIVYSTCSVYGLEDEGVVSRVLKKKEFQQMGWRAAERDDCLPAWERRGREEECNGVPNISDSFIRCVPEDGTIGFFVACIVRDPSLIVNDTETTYKKYGKKEQGKNGNEQGKYGKDKGKNGKKSTPVAPVAKQSKPDKSEKVTSTVDALPVEASKSPASKPTVTKASGKGSFVATASAETSGKKRKSTLNDSFLAKVLERKIKKSKARKTA